jgi:pyrrolidone-carboxylate peptidase
MPEILLTCFGPFRKRAKNGSQTLVHRIVEEYGDHHLHALDLDVVWGEVERVAVPFIEKSRPDAIFSFGEGPPDVIRIERCGKNEQTGSDEHGEERRSVPISKGGPEVQPGRFPAPEPETEIGGYPVVDSDDCGAFLCNNMLYRAALSPAKHAVFIHLPPQNEEPDDTYADRLLPLFPYLLDRLT